MFPFVFSWLRLLFVVLRVRPRVLLRLAFVQLCSCGWSSSASHIFALESGMSILGSGFAFIPRPVPRGQKCLALARTWTKGRGAAAGGRTHACAASNNLPRRGAGRRRRWLARVPCRERGVDRAGRCGLRGRRADGSPMRSAWSRGRSRIPNGGPCVTSTWVSFGTLLQRRARSLGEDLPNAVPKSGVIGEP